MSAKLSLAVIKGVHKHSLGTRKHVVRDEGDYERHVDYLHYNPVKHGQVTRVADWPYSSFHQYVERGIYYSGHLTVLISCRGVPDMFSPEIISHDMRLLLAFT